MVLQFGNNGYPAPWYSTGFGQFLPNHEFFAERRMAIWLWWTYYRKEYNALLLNDVLRLQTTYHITSTSDIPPNEFQFFHLFHRYRRPTWRTNTINTFWRTKGLICLWEREVDDIILLKTWRNCVFAEPFHAISYLTNVREKFYSSVLLFVTAHRSGVETTFNRSPNVLVIITTVHESFIKMILFILKIFWFRNGDGPMY